MRTTGNQLKNISIDDLSERILICFSSKKRNEVGDEIEDKKEIRVKCNAKIFPYMSRSTDDQGLELSNDVIYRVVIWYRSNIQTDDIIIWRDKILKVRSPPIDVEGRHFFTQFECIEEVANH